MTKGAGILLGLLALIALWFIWRWVALERPRHANKNPGLVNTIVGFVTNFFDALGIGSFATTTAIFKFRKQMADEEIPGTLNVGHALPVVAEAFVFIAVVSVDMTTLVGMIAAAALGGWLGVGIVSRLPRRAIQLGMGVALLVAAMLFLARNMEWMPGGGTALGLEGGVLAFAIFMSFILGALMMLGIGFYGPCLIMVSLLGMNPLAAFPIMMGACAFLMPVGGARFVATGRYNLRAALGLTLGGIPAVLIAALIVKSLPIDWLRWLVLVVVAYAGVLMLVSARRNRSPSMLPEKEPA